MNASTETSVRDGGRNRIALRLVKKCMHKCHRGGRQESLATNEGVGEYKGEKPRGRDVKRRKRKGSVGTSVWGEKMSVIVERIK